MQVRYWGTEGSGDGQFSAPHGVAVGSSGIIYVCDSANNRIQLFSSEGAFIHKWGKRGSLEGELVDPTGLTTNTNGGPRTNGLVLLVLKSIPELNGWPSGYVFDVNGNFLRKWGSKGTDDGKFHRPSACIMDRNGVLYVCDTSNHRIQSFQCDGTFVRKWGSRGSRNGYLRFPSGISASHDGLLFVADSGNRLIQCFRSDGTFMYRWGHDNIGMPLGIAVHDAIVYVTDDDNFAVHQCDKGGTWIRKFGSRGNNDDQFARLTQGIAVDACGRIYVSDRDNHRIMCVNFNTGDK